MIARLIPDATSRGDRVGWAKVSHAGGVVALGKKVLTCLSRSRSRKSLGNMRQQDVEEVQVQEDPCATVLSSRSI